MVTMDLASLRSMITYRSAFLFPILTISYRRDRSKCRASTDAPVADAGTAQCRSEWLYSRKPK